MAETGVYTAIAAVMKDLAEVGIQKEKPARWPTNRWSSRSSAYPSRARR